MLFFLSLLCADSFAVPQTISQQGRLLDTTGAPLQGTHNLTFRVFESPASTTALWSESLTALFDNGFYTVILGSDTSNSLDSTLLAIEPLYLEMQLDSESPFLPRQKLNAQLYARHAGQATSLMGGSVDATQIQVGGSVVIDFNGSWVGPTINLGWDDIQNIPSDFADGVDNDTVLSEDEVEDFITNGALDLAEGTTIGGKELQVAISCLEGQILQYDGSLGWSCTEDSVLTSDDVLDYVTQNPIDLATSSSVDGKEIVSQNAPCDDQQILVYDFASSMWICGNDKDTDTQLSADEIVSLLTDRALQLASGTTVDGQKILTENSTVSWNKLSDVPNGLEDGDDQGIDIACDEGEILTFTSGNWACTPFNTVIDADSDGVLTWNDCDDDDVSLGALTEDADCDGVLTVDDCDDNDLNSTIKSEDSDCDTILAADDCDDSDAIKPTLDVDCDGTLTVDDCDDNDAFSTKKSEDADCDTVLTVDDCDDNNASLMYVDGSSSSCPAYSCLEILNNGYSNGDGNYWIQPASTAIEVTCDMSTEGGGYTYYPVSGGISTNRYTDNNTCKSLGMDIVYPRSRDHWQSMVDRFGTSYFPFIPGVYKSGSGGSYTGCAMNSSGCGDWRVGDGGRWFLRSSTYSEPNGDYTANCWLATRDVGNPDDITFNDGNCSYGGSTYMCSTNDKP